MIATVCTALLCATAPQAAALAPDEGTPQTSGNEWAQWRGPTRDGRFHGPAWPAELKLRTAWRMDGLGPSYASPVVTADRVFTVATEDEAHEVVIAVDRASGEEVWRASWEGAMKVPFFAARNGSWIRSSPAYDGESLYVAGIRDVLACLDAATGEVRWTVDFVEREGSPLPQFGFVCSPLVVGDHVYVQAGASFVKLDKATGETVWRTLDQGEGGGLDSSFSSPVLAEVGGREQLLVQTRTDLTGVAPENGDVLWSMPVKTFRGMNILTPLLYGDGIFTAPYGGRAQLLQLESGDDGLSVSQAWTNRAQGYMTSPVLVGDHVYLFLRSNRFACVDLRTGEDAWISEPTGDSYWSLVAQGDRILALADTGILRLIQATPEGYRVLGEREVLDDETWAHLAAAGDQLFVRGLDTLLALEWE
ncbi:MAG: PQQ-binding-like beta-propeller repeat protein [Planctomycetota bacterium]